MKKGEQSNDKGTVKYSKGHCYFIDVGSSFLYISSMDNWGGYTPSLQFVGAFNSSTKLCVCMFAFLNGWAFAIDDATYRRAFEKIKKLLTNYWCVAIPATAFAVLICKFDVNAKLLVKILFGFDTTLMIFAWYVPFYCVSILVMTYIKKLLDKSIFRQ